MNHKLVFILSWLALCIRPSVSIGLADDNAAQAVTGLKAYAAFKTGDYDKARQIWQDLAARGNTTAMINLANLFQQGKGVTADQKEAFEYIKQAAELGDPRAQYELGVEFEKGILIPRDIDKATSWLLKSAEQGDTDGQFAYAVMLATSYGKGQEYSSKRERADALGWFEKARQGGHPDATAYIQLLSSIKP